MADQPGAGRLDPETLAAYIDGLLPPEERAKVEVEIATDPESYEWVVNAVNAVDDASIAMVREASVGPVPAPRPAPPRLVVLPFYRRRDAQAVLAGLAAAAALVLVVRTQPVWWQSLWGPSVDPRFAKLVEAVGEERYIEARLTGGFKYGPLRQVMRGPGDLSTQNLQLLAAAGELQKAAEKDPTAENLHAWGVAQLLVGDTRGAIASMQSAEELGGENARLLNDLAVAYLNVAEDEAPEMLALALDASTRASQAAPDSAEVRFTEAVCLERSGLLEQAIVAWQAYIALDGSTEWAQIARERSAALRRQRSGRSVSPSSGYAARTRPTAEVRDGQLWVELQQLDTAVQLLREGRTESRAAHGSFFVRAVVTQFAATSDRDSLLLAGRLMEALRTTTPLDTKATAALTAFGGPVGLLLPLLPGPRGQQWLDVVSRNATDASRLGYFAVASELRRRQGLEAASRGRYDDALVAYRLADEAARRLNDVPQTVAVSAMTAEAYRYLSDERRVWAHLRRGIGAATAADLDGRPLHQLRSQAFMACARWQRSSCASRFVEGLAQNAVDTDDDAALAIAEYQAARLLAARGDTDAARRYLSRARQLTELIEPAQTQIRIAAEIDVSEGALLAPGPRLEALDRAIRVFEGDATLARMPRLLVERSNTYRQLGALTEARRDAHDALRLIVGERERLGQAAFAATRVADYNEAFDGFLAGLFASGASEFTTLNAVEAAHSLQVPRLEGAGYDRAPIPAGHVVVVLRVLEEAVHSWVVEGHAIVHRAHPAKRLEISRDIRYLRAAVARQDLRAFDLASERLYEVIARPWLPTVRRGAALHVVPDAVLADLPLGALRDARTGLYLTQITPLTVLPAALATSLTEAMSAEPVQFESVLSLADPANGGFDDLPPLRGATREAEAVARAYSRSEMVRGRDVLRRLQRGQLEQFDVIHFAGHVVADPVVSGRSFVPVIDSDGRPYRLSLEVFSELSRAARLVVLASCHSISTSDFGGAGNTLASALLGRGVKTVLASLWEIDDAAIPQLMEGFHVRVRAGVAPAEAWSAEVRSQDAKPWVWAGFSIFGT